MKALVVLENHFYLDKDNNVWCDRVVDYDYLKRYLNNFDSIILTGRTEKIDKIKENKLLVSGKNVKFIPMPDFRGAKGLILNYFKINQIIKEQIKNCDLAIYRAPTHLSLFTYKQILKNKKPLLLEFMMAANKMFEEKNIVQKFFNKIIDYRAKKMCLKANGVSYVTEKILQDTYPCKAILEPKNNKYFTESYSSIDLNKEMYFKQDWNKNIIPKEFNLIHVGYMDSLRKGQHIAIKAINEVINRGYKVNLTLIGDGEKRKDFENLAKELKIENKVIFKGMIKKKQEILDEMKKSHIMIFPTYSEGLPRTIIEGMSQGLVCISSPVDGIPELLGEEFLIDCEDYMGYSNKIIELINNWEKCCIESEKNYNKSLKYEKSNLENKRDNFYRKIGENSEKNYL